MKRTIFLLFAVLTLPSIAFAGGAGEAATAPAAEDPGMELGSVINRPFPLIVPNDMTPELRGGTVVIERFKASPMWKEMVVAGELPPVDERLPEEPLVLQPRTSIGKYGGWMRTLRPGGAGSREGE